VKADAVTVVGQQVTQIVSASVTSWTKAWQFTYQQTLVRQNVLNNKSTTGIIANVTIRPIVKGFTAKSKIG